MPAPAGHRSQMYMSEADQVRSTAAGTGVAGGYLENGFLGLTAGMVAAPYALAAAAALSESAVSGIVVTGFRTMGAQMVKQFTWNTFKLKVGSDLAVQFGGGLVKNNGNALRSLSEVNITSLLTSWLLPASGFVGSMRNAVIKSTVRTNVALDDSAPPRFSLRLPQLNSMEGFGNYLTTIGFDVVGDRLKSNLVKGMAPMWARSMVTLRQSGSELGRWVAENRITLGTFGQVGTSLIIKVAKDKEKALVAERLKPNTPRAAHP